MIKSTKLYLMRYKKSGRGGILHSSFGTKDNLPEAAISGALCKYPLSLLKSEVSGFAVYNEMVRKCAICRHRLYNATGGDCSGLKPGGEGEQ